ncbi:STAS domain-containing protein [Streptomyces sp. NPDC006624]|uniref:STAS domain-containing protein n=1 Tax=unclassified Streptomyces TaxID=2593676 RepID=UPI0033B0B441
MSEHTPGRSTPPPAPRPAARAGGGPAVVTLRGEIDLLTAPELRSRLDSLTAVPCPDLVLDLRPVSFIDCAGLGVLCRARNRVLARKGRLRLVTDSACVRRTLRGAGLAGVFEVLARPPAEASAGQALTASASRPVG